MNTSQTENTAAANTETNSAPTNNTAPNAADVGNTNAPQATQDQSTQQATQFKIPDTYKDKPWASKIKTEDDLYKQIDTLDSLKGKKNIIPDFTKSTPEEIEEYLKTSRPKDKAEYQFDEGVDPQLKEGFTEILYKNGITAYQANQLIKDYNQMEAAKKVELYDKDAFMKKAEEKFGKDYTTNLLLLKTQLRPFYQKRCKPKLMQCLMNIVFRLIK